jgi:hypothetical protein
MNKGLKHFLYLEEHQDGRRGMQALVNDRRLHRRYRAAVGAELRTQDNESILCRIVDISATGVAVQCENIPDELSVSLRLDGFGPLTVSRLRARSGTERLVLRETDARTRQFLGFISGLVDAGKAMPILTRRRVEETGENRPAAPSAFHIGQTLTLIARVANRDGSLPGNVTLFPSPDRKSQDEPPDLTA